jgi:hypothetical protein
MFRKLSKKFEVGIELVVGVSSALEFTLPRGITKRKNQTCNADWELLAGS